MPTHRFDLRWRLPLEPGLVTHVTLLDFSHQPPTIIAEAYGADEVDTLLDLWTTLMGRRHTEDAAIAVVATAYTRRTGHAGRLDETPQIENDHDYRMAEARVKMFRRGIAASEHAGAAFNLAPQLRTASIDAMRSQVSALQREMRCYIDRDKLPNRH